MIPSFLRRGGSDPGEFLRPSVENSQSAFSSLSGDSTRDVLSLGTRRLRDIVVEVLREVVERKDEGVAEGPSWLSREVAQSLLLWFYSGSSGDETEGELSTNRTLMKRRNRLTAAVDAYLSDGKANPLLGLFGPWANPSAILAATPRERRGDVLALILAELPRMAQSKRNSGRMAGVLLNGGPEAPVLLAWLLGKGSTDARELQLPQDSLLTKAANLVLCVALTQAMGVPVRLPWLLGSRGSDVGLIAAFAAQIGVAQGQGLAPSGFSLTNIAGAAALLQMLPPDVRGRAVGELGLAPGLLVQLRSLWKALEDAAKADPDQLNGLLAELGLLAVYLGKPFPGIESADRDLVLPQVFGEAKRLLKALSEGVSVSPAASRLLLHVCNCGVSPETESGSPAANALKDLLPFLVGALRGFAHALARDSNHIELQRTRVANLSLLLGLLRSLEAAPFLGIQGTVLWAAQKNELWVGCRQILGFYGTRDLAEKENRFDAEELGVLRDCLTLMKNLHGSSIGFDRNALTPLLEDMREGLCTQFSGLLNDKDLKFKTAKFMAGAFLSFALENENVELLTAVLGNIQEMVKVFFRPETEEANWHTGASIALMALEKLGESPDLYSEQHDEFRRIVIGRCENDGEMKALFESADNTKGRERLPHRLRLFLNLPNGNDPEESS